MIRLPRKHIADSVTERIMAVEKRLSANHVSSQGLRLDKALMQPIGDIAAIEGIEEMIPARALDL